MSSSSHCPKHRASYIITRVLLRVYHVRLQIGTGELDLRDRENHIFVLHCTMCVDRWTTVSETTLRLIYDLHTTHLNEILMDNCPVSFIPTTTTTTTVCLYVASCRVLNYTSVVIYTNIFEINRIFSEIKIDVYPAFV